MIKINKKAQEEMIGFALIIVIVAVLILVFVSISLNKKVELQESYIAGSFVQSIIEYTTNCSNNYDLDYIPIRNLAKKCFQNQICFNGEDSCEMLNSTMHEILSNSWIVGENRPEKGYLFNITAEGEELMGFKEGNITRTSKGSTQSFDELDFFFEIYY
ncbi:hypothetical protein HOD29_03610 [archaeon]|jgi:hypothetical protein|nr:hypothetical protein [archaeon]